ncbi:MAG: O-antigen ligase family protein [Nitrospinae bacterium]|nr:O-antigen ligase family protein [Nitrospinota bacterium]
MMLLKNIYKFNFLLLFLVPPVLFDSWTLEQFPAIKEFSYEILFILFILFLLISGSNKKDIMVSEPGLNILAVILVCFIGVSILFSESYLFAIYGFSVVLCLYVIFIASQRIFLSFEEIKRFLFPLFIASSFISLLGLLQFLCLAFFLPQSVLMTSTLGHIDLIAQYLLLFIPLLFVFIFISRGKEQVLFMIFFFLNLGCFLSTYVRGHLLALIAAGFLGLIFYLQFLHKKKYIDVKTSKRILSLSLILLCFLVYKQPQVIKSLPVISLFIGCNAGAVGEVNGRESWRLSKNILLRQYTWSSTIEMIADNPVFGVGIGNYPLIYPLYERWQEKEMENRIRWYAHNDYLQLAAESGLPTLFIFLYFIAVLFKKSITYLIRCENKERSLLLFGLLLSLFAFLVSSLFSFNFYQLAPALLFWLFAGLIIFLIQDGQNKKTLLLPRLSQKAKKVVLLVSCILSLIFLVRAYHNYKAEILFALGVQYTTEDRYQDSGAIFEKIIKLSSNKSKYYYEAARAALFAKEYKKAEESIKLALKLTPNVPETKYLYGLILYEAGKISESVKTLKSILVLDEYNAFALNLLLRIYKENNRVWETRVIEEKIEEYRRKRLVAIQNGELIL